MAALSMSQSLMERVHERELDEAQAFEDRAEKAGTALMARLEALESQPQHIRDREYLELVRDIFVGSKYGRRCLHSLLESIAQDPEREPSELVIRWHRGAA